MNTVFIYVLKCPVTGMVRYVGKAKNARKRFWAHLNRVKENNHRACWMRSLKAKGLRPVLEVLDEVPEDVWPQWEVAYIQFFREEGCDLTNGNDGGEGGHNPSEQERQRRRVAATGKHYCLGKPKSEEHKAAISAGRMGHKRSEESKLKQSITNTGRKASPAHCEAIGAAHRGRKQSPAQIAWKVGKTCSPEKRAAISASHIRHHAARRAAGKANPLAGQKHSPEHTAKAVASRKANAAGKVNPLAGRKQLPEHTAKRIATRKANAAGKVNPLAGRKWSPESIAKGEATRKANAAAKLAAQSLPPSGPDNPS